MARSKLVETRARWFGKDVPMAPKMDLLLDAEDEKTSTFHLQPQQIRTFNITYNNSKKGGEEQKKVEKAIIAKNPK